MQFFQGKSKSEPQIQLPAYRTLPSGDPIPSLGLGTWRMGGAMSADHRQDRRALKALENALEVGYTHFDTAEMYAGGHTEELLGQAIRGLPRENIFITTKIWQTHLHYDAVQRALDGSLRRLGVNYIDLYLIHWPSESFPLEETFRALNDLHAQGLVRNLGVSNFDLEELQSAQALSESPLATDQVPYSLSTRRYARNGVLEYCQKTGLLLTAYTPLEKGSVKAIRTVREIARQYGATPAQVALAWLLHQPNVITIPMSMNPKHIRENFGALTLRLSDEDLRKLNETA